MIAQTTTRQPTTAAQQPTPTWQRQLSAAVSDLDELLRLVDLDRRQIDCPPGSEAGFPLRVPRPFIARMRPGDPQDPLLLQVLPRGAELDTAAGFGEDPVGEAAAAPAPGLLHKYRGRALLLTTSACAVHCRYCFRRHFPYQDHQAWGEQWQPACDWLRNTPSIEEVIYSGGDPLSLNDAKLAQLTERLAEIPHLQRLRIHTRLPVVLPSRVTSALLDWLTGSRLRPVVVLHVNHPRELDDAVRAACHRLRQRGVTLLNQAVLLRGVNDSAATLSELGAALFTTGIQPYYLHLLDRVRGATHFEVPTQEGQRIYAELMASTSGYLVPKLVREVPGAASKTPQMAEAPIAPAGASPQS